MIRLIDITDDDIKNGVQCDTKKCAIARALKREYKTDNVEVAILDDYVSLCVGKDLSLIPIWAADERSSVDPGGCRTHQKKKHRNNNNQ